MDMSMGGSKPHACMHATCNTHTYTWTHATLTHPCGTQHTTQHTHTHAQVLNLLPTFVKDCTFRDLHIDQGIINAEK